MNTMGLIRLEWALLSRDRVFWLALLVALLCLGYGLYNGHAWATYQNALAGHNEKAGLEQLKSLKATADQARKDNLPLPEGLNDRQNDSRYAIGFANLYKPQSCRKPTPLAMLTVGQSDLVGLCVPVSVWATEGAFADGGDSDTARVDLENPLRLLMGRFDAAFVILLLLPVAVMVMSYDLLSRERELGTLPLLRSQPVSLRRIVSIRFGLRAVLSISLIIGGVGLAMFLDMTDWQNTAAMELALWLCLTGAYLIFWFACAFWLNSRGNSSARQGLQLIGVWLLFAVILPCSLNLVMKHVYPTPSRLGYIDKLREASLSIEKQKTALLGKYLGDHPDLAQGNQAKNADEFIGTKIALNAENKRILGPIKQAFREQSVRQQGFVEMTRFLSPALAYQHASQLLAGQDLARHQRFMDAVASYQRALGEFYFPRFLVDNERFADYAAIPSLKFEELPFSRQWHLALPALLAICLPSLGLVLAGVMNLRRRGCTVPTVK